MIAATIYIVFFLAAVILNFVKKDFAIKYKNALISIHIFSLLILFVDIFLIIKYSVSYKGIWVDRIFAIIFLISGVSIFSLYRKRLRLWLKIYYSFFFFYPIMLPVAYLADKILFVIVSSPLFVTLNTPEIYYCSNSYDIRSMQGMMTASRFVLIKKDIITEVEIGKSDESGASGQFTKFKIISQNSDSTKISVKSNGSMMYYTFRK